jgi:hypothetical protein
MKWIIGALALAALAWLAATLFRGEREEVVTEVPATETVTETVTETTTAVADPLIVDGVNIGESIQGILTNITGTLAGVTDVDTATAAVQALTDADNALGGLGTAVGALTGEGKSALQALIGGALPSLRTTIDGLLADTGIGPILKPALDGILAKLTSFGG